MGLDEPFVPLLGLSWSMAGIFSQICVSMRLFAIDYLNIGILTQQNKQTQVLLTWNDYEGIKSGHITF